MKKWKTRSGALVRSFERNQEVGKSFETNKELARVHTWEFGKFFQIYLQCVGRLVTVLPQLYCLDGEQSILCLTAGEKHKNQTVS